MFVIFHLFAEKPPMICTNFVAVPVTRGPPRGLDQVFQTFCRSMRAFWI